MRGAIIFFLWWLGANVAAAPNEPAAAGRLTILEISGTVTIQRVGGANRVNARVGDTLAPGDTVRSGEDSWMVFRLGDQSTVRKGPLTTIVIRPPPAAGKKPELDLIGGILYFFGRDRPDAVRIRTPGAAGAIRGTEFNIFVPPSGETILTMIDGEVDFSSGAESVTLKNNSQGHAAAGRVSTSGVSDAEARDVIQWCLYYPVVLDLNDLELGADAKAKLQESIGAYQLGDVRAALGAWPANYQLAGKDEVVFYAALLLANGSIDHALQVLGANNSRPAQALRHLVEAVKLRASTGFETASTTEFLADSYAAQSRADLDRALMLARLAVVQRANTNAPAMGAAWARIAELEFSFGHTDAAADALRQALAVSPKLASAHVLKGFAEAAKGHWSAAEASFNEALDLDGALGNAWLGRGLIKIRRGHWTEGREDLQTAALMEPQRAILRSYLGKAHFETGDNENALRELELAVRLDPKDPTAWLYRAILDQQENRLNEGISALEESKRLNNNRALFRSRLLLDQDQAVRSANLAALYRDVGLTEVSVREAGRAVNYDYANGSAHLFLANSYDALRDPNQVNLRYETAWLNELLLANLLTPVGAGSLSQSVSQQEYSSLFAGDQFGLSSGTRYLSSGDWQTYASQYGTVGGMSYALDTVYLSKNGEVPNTDIDQLSVFAKFKQQLTAKDSIFVETVYYRNDSGDVRQYYNPANAAGQFRFQEFQEPTTFVGYHREWSPEHHTLALFGYLQDKAVLTNGNASFLVLDLNPPPPGTFNGVVPLDNFQQGYLSKFGIWTAEAQHIWTPPNHQFVIGGRFQRGDIDTSSFLARPNVFPPIGLAAGVPQANSVDIERETGYAYWHYQILDDLRLIGGVSYDRLNFPVNVDFPPIANGQRVEESVSPKAGFIYNPEANTWLRGAFTRSLGGLYFDNSARLEPAQVAGFTQGFRSAIPESEAGSLPGAEFETYALGIDHRFPTRTYVGLDGGLLSARGRRSIGVWDFYTFPAPVPGQQIEKLEYDEKSLTATLHQLIDDQYSAGLTYRLSEARLTSALPGIPTAIYEPQFPHVEGTLQELRLFGIWNHPRGWFAEAEGVWIDQTNRGYQGTRPDEDFWQANVYAGYRFPRRQAELRIGLLNANNQSYNLSPLNLHDSPPRRRTLAVEFKFNF